MTNPTSSSSDISFAALKESLIGEIELEEDQYTKSLPHNVLAIREIFLLEWNTLIKLCQDVTDKSSTWRVTRSEFFTKKKEITSKVYNWLKKYTFELHKTELGGTQYITREAKDKLENNLTDYLTQLNGDPLLFDPLIQEIKTAHSKELDFRTKAFKIFRREIENKGNKQ